MSQIKIEVTEKGIGQTERKLVKLEKTGGKTEGKVNDLKIGIKKLGHESKESKKSIDNQAQALGSLRAKSAAAAIAIATMTVSATENNKMLERGAYVAGLLASEYQAMSLASKSVGVDISQLESILGDTEEKIGEFINAGSGGFQDFADAMGLTKEQARETAIELQNLSGRDVLIEMVKQMEAADLTAEQMNNALESMGSEARYLLPLLKDGATDLKNLEGRFGALATTLDKDTTAKLNELNTVVGIAASNMKNALASAIAGVSTELVFAAENAAFFYGSLQAGTIQNITSNMARVNDQIKTTRKEVKQLKEEDESFLIEIADAVGITSTQEQIEIREKMLSDLESKYKKLQSDYKSLAGLELPDKPKRENTKKPNPISLVPPKDDMDAQVEALRMSFMSEQELAENKLAKDLEIIELSKIAEKEKHSLSLKANEEYYKKLDEIEKKRNLPVESVKASLMTEKELSEARLKREIEIINESTLAKDEQRALEEEAEAAHQERLRVIKEDASKAALDQFKADNEEALSIINAAGNAVSSSISSGIMGLVKNTKTAKEATLDVITSITDSIIKSSMDILIKRYVVDNITKGLLVTQTSADVARGSALAAMNAYASTAAIPIVGPALAPAAAAEAATTASSIGSAAISAAAARFQGGDVSGGSSYQWQERGGEAFMPNVDGRVFSKNDMKSMMSGGGGSGVTVVNNIYNQTGANVTSVPNDQGGEDIYITRDEFSSMMAAEGGNPDSEFNNSITNVWTMGGRA